MKPTMVWFNKNSTYSIGKCSWKTRKCDQQIFIQIKRKTFNLINSKYLTNISKTNDYNNI